MKVLIVDDSEIEVVMLGSMLEAEGIEVASEFSGVEILDKVLHHRPDLILLDLHMPNISGIEVCRILTGDYRTRGLPIIIISSDETKRLEAIEAGGVEYIEKPICKDCVIKSVRRMGALGEIINLCKSIIKY